jgi:hypothetical protein
VLQIDIPNFAAVTKAMHSFVEEINFPQSGKWETLTWPKAKTVQTTQKVSIHSATPIQHTITKQSQAFLIVSVPTLIVDAVSTSSTPNEITLIVDVNDCIGVEQLRIRVTVNGVSLNESYSRRTSFTFSNQSPGNYICSVAIVDVNETQESRNISCISPGM